MYLVDAVDVYQQGRDLLDVFGVGQPAAVHRAEVWYLSHQVHDQGLGLGVAGTAPHLPIQPLSRPLPLLGAPVLSVVEGKETAPAAFALALQIPKFLLD